MADKNKNKDTEKWQAEWLELVHNGACCADVDPHKEQKKGFIDSLSNTESKSKVEKDTPKSNS